GPDGAAGMLATAYAGNAHLFMGRLDLSGIAQVTFEFRSGDNRHPFTVELRADSATGALLGSTDVRPAVADKWYTQSVALSASGERALYVVLRSPAGGIGQFNSLVTMDAMTFEKRR
ncbi:MAG: hypothetical protein ABIP93_18305, partial [Gemmatimonadaceae bacterium]